MPPMDHYPPIGRVVLHAQGLSTCNLYAVACFVRGYRQLGLTLSVRAYVRVSDTHSAESNLATMVLV